MARKILTEHTHIPGIDSFDVYRKHGGYTSVEKALKKMSPENVLDEVKKSGLRGRGGAGFPTAMKWSFLAKGTGKPAYLLNNADESEPGTFKDRFLMEKTPHLCLEGMICSAYALGVNVSYIYIRGEFKWIIKIMEKAIAEAKANGFLGKNILGSGYDLEIYMQTGGGAYICGEETALIESLEGLRGNPRIKPPFPAVSGVWGCPTVVNNTETLAAVKWIIDNSGDEYAKIGIGKSTGTKLISACGHINKPGVYEIDLGLPVEEFIYSDEYCGGILNGHELKAVIPGGSSVPVLPKNLILKTANGEPRLMSFESLADGGFVSGSMLGSGGFIALDETTCMVHNTLNFTQFYHHESCGQCSPCREGTGWMKNVLKRLENGEGKMSDMEMLVDIANNIDGKTICPLGDAAAWPVVSAIRHFREEFNFHAKYPEKAKQTAHPARSIYHAIRKPELV